MINNLQSGAEALGAELNAIRKVRELSLVAVAEPAKISAAYLQKLENGSVQNPSPRVLMRLAGVLHCDYDRLMTLVGYVTSPQPSKGGKATFLEAALRNEDLSDAEQRAVLAFISYLKGVRT